MIREYIREALNQAHYELIDDKHPYYGEVKKLNGVWANGDSLEECRTKLSEVIEGWILMRVGAGLEIPPLRKRTIEVPKQMAIHG